MILSEIMTIMVYFHVSGFRTFKDYYLRFVSTDLKKIFSKSCKLFKIYRIDAYKVRSYVNFLNDKGEIFSSVLTSGNVDDRNVEVIKKLMKELYGKLFWDRGYISSNLFDMLLERDIQFVTKLKKNMKNKLMSLFDKLMLRKRSIIETINDELKNICQIEHTRHRCMPNFLVNLFSGLTAYSYFPKKPSIKLTKNELKVIPDNCFL
jgi:hypothetical protein